MISNPKKQITVDYNTTQVKEALLKITNTNSDYIVYDNNEILKTITLSATELLSIGVFIDITYKSLSESSTEVFIEVRRKTGAFDKDYEVSKAYTHITNVLNGLSTLLVNPSYTTPKKTSLFRKVLSVIAWIFGISILLAIPSSNMPILNVVIFLCLISRTLFNLYKKFTK